MRKGDLPQTLMISFLFTVSSKHSLFGSKLEFPRVEHQPNKVVLKANDCIFRRGRSLPLARHFYCHHCAVHKKNYGSVRRTLRARERQVGLGQCAVRA
jgi:hypothetical protein